MSESIQYIINDKDERVAVIIPIKEFEVMLAQIGLTLDDYEREPSSPRKTLLEQLGTAGKIEV